MATTLFTLSDPISQNMEELTVLIHKKTNDFHKL